MSGRTRRVIGRDQMQPDLAAEQSGIEGRRAVLEADVEAELVAIVGEARLEIADREHGRAGLHHRGFPLATCFWKATSALEHSMSRRRTKSVCTRASALARRWTAMGPPRQVGPTSARGI